MKHTLLVAALIAAVPAAADGPMYKPSSKSKAPIDITTNAYGHSALAPDAPKLGDQIASFELPATTSGKSHTFNFDKARQKGPLVLVFYRGDW